MLETSIVGSNPLYNRDFLLNGVLRNTSVIPPLFVLLTQSGNNDPLTLSPLPLSAITALGIMFPYILK